MVVSEASSQCGMHKAKKKTVGCVQMDPVSTHGEMKVWGEPPQHMGEIIPPTNEGFTWVPMVNR